MLCARAVPRLVHLHRGPQGEAAAAPRGRPAAHGQRPRPLRHRLRALHVLRDLRRGVPVRRAVLEPGVRVLRAQHRRAAPRQGASSASGWRPCPSPSRSRLGAEAKQEVAADGRRRTSPSGSSRSAMAGRRDRRRALRRTSCTPRCSSSSCSPARPRSTSCWRPSSSPGCRCSSTSAPSSSCSCSGSCSPARRCGGDAELDNDQRWPAAVVVAVPVRRARRRCSSTRSATTRSSSTTSSSTTGRTATVGDAIFRDLRDPVRGRVDAAARRARRRRRHRAEGLSAMILNQFLILAAFLFCIGVYGVLARRNGVLVLMSVELMLNAVNINLVAFSALPQRRRRARCSPCSSSRSPPPRSASAWRSCSSSTATCAAPTSTRSTS